MRKLKLNSTTRKILLYCFHSDAVTPEIVAAVLTTRGKRLKITPGQVRAARNTLDKLCEKGVMYKDDSDRNNVERYHPSGNVKRMVSRLATMKKSINDIEELVY